MPSVSTLARANTERSATHNEDRSEIRLATEVIMPNEATAMSIERVISGGQTGVDRAALDVALELGVPCGGWCPRGRRAEDGPIPTEYPLFETPSRQYQQRTRWNVRDADGTLIITAGELTGGSALTQTLADRLGRPCRVVDLDASRAVVPVARWVRQNGIQTLNIAGPRESTTPGIGKRVERYLRRLLLRNRK